MIIEGDNLKRLQGKLLELLKEVDRICRKNGIEYTLEGGTLLGSIRHGGFIPWDDDADVIFMRDEYKKFYEACKTDLDPKYFLQEFRTDPEYHWGYSKLRINGTKFIQEKQEDLKFHKGIFIDVFIYDGVPDHFPMRQIHFFECFFIRKCQYSIVGRKYAPNAFLRGWYSLINHIPKKTVFNWMNRIAERNNNSKKKHYLSRHMTFPYRTKQSKYGLPTHCFDEYIDVKFEDTTLRILKGYNEYMTLKFGDYMTLPPPEKRIGVLHVVDIDFGED